VYNSLNLSAGALALLATKALFQPSSLCTFWTAAFKGAQSDIAPLHQLEQTDASALSSSLELGV
jgi:hypothetical protein